nr:hypothetical protein [Nakamurella antarctica]
MIVLTHHARPDLKIGETTFRFRIAPPQEELHLAAERAGGLDVRLARVRRSPDNFSKPTSSTSYTSWSSRFFWGGGVRPWDAQEGLEERFNIETTGSPSGVVQYFFTRRARQ